MGGAQKRRLSSDEEETLDQIENGRGGGRNRLQPRAQRRSIPKIAAGTQLNGRDEIRRRVVAHDARHPDVRKHPSTAEVNEQARRVLGNSLNRSAFASNTPAQRTNAGSNMGNGVLADLQESTESLRISPFPLSGQTSLGQSSTGLLGVGSVNSRKRRKLASPSATQDTEPKKWTRATVTKTMGPVRSSRKVPASPLTVSPEDTEASEDEDAKKLQHKKKLQHEKTLQHAKVAKLFLKVEGPPGDWRTKPASRRFPPSSALSATDVTTTINIENDGNEFQENELRKCLKYLSGRNFNSTTRFSQSEMYRKQLDHRLSEEQATSVIEDHTPTSSSRWVGLDYSKAPIHDISEIFEDIVSRGLDNNGPCKLDTCSQELQARRLRIGTMCSGTESPIISLKMINAALKRNQLPEIFFHHVMSWEIVPWKQAYIQRNFNVDVLFRDVTEISDADDASAFATTAFGAEARIPGDLDLVIAGSSCVDFSSLNSVQKTLDDGGQSAVTFVGVMRYAKRFKPKMMILENVKGAPWASFAELFQKIGYETVVGWLDSKDFYIPHTRERGYFVAILKESAAEAGLDPARACANWQTAVGFLRRRASSPFTDFVLKDDDPILFDARRTFAFSDLLDSDAKQIPWAKCLQRHMTVRGGLNLGEKNPLTRWQKNGTCNYVDSGWVNYIKNLVERLWDTIDINYLRAASERDYDISCKCRCLELSQNVDRSVDPYAWGMVGCLTCGAQPFITSRGGPLIGREALALQGIPPQSLSLAHETSKDLLDFAGNAMTTTVVGSVVLAAICVTYPMLKIGESKSQSSPKLVDVAIETSNPLLSTDLTNDAVSIETLTNIEVLAGKTLQLCSCEGHVDSKTVDLQECTLCGHSTCKVCGRNPAHEYENISDALSGERKQPSEFEQKIRELLPLQLHISDLSGTFITDAWTRSYGDISREATEKAVDATVHLSSIRRGRHWIITYDSCFSRLELVFEPAWNTTSPLRTARSIVSKAHWYLYAKPDPQRPALDLQRDVLCSPIARMSCSKSLFEGSWDWRMSDAQSFDLTVEGSGNMINSWQQRLGLEQRRFKNQKVWKLLTLSLAQPPTEACPMNILGTYEALPECGTACGTLHRLIEGPTAESEAPIFLFLEQKPFGNSSGDSLVFSKSHRRLLQGESRDIIASAPNGWRPDPANMGGPLTCRVPGLWRPTTSPRLTVPAPETTVTLQYSTLESLGLQNFVSCRSARSTVLMCQFPLQEDRQRLWIGGQKYDIDLDDKPKALGPFDWLIQRAANSCCGDWLTIPDRDHQDMACRDCAPEQPPFLRQQIANGTDAKYKEDPEQAYQYEQAIKKRPSPVTAQLDCSETHIAKLRIDLDVVALLHRAYAKLACSDSKLDVACRLVRDQQFQQLDRFPTITMASNGGEERAPPLPPTIFKLDLKDTQRLSLHWMINQECARAGPWIEEEIEEVRMPAADLRLEARVRCKRLVRGGVLADAVGSGKTAVMLALAAFDNAGGFSAATPLPSNGSGPLSSKATLILAPKNLCDQWYTEIEKFYPENRFKVVYVRSLAGFTRHTVHGILNADIVLSHWDLFDNDYFHRLAQISSDPTDQENGDTPDEGSGNPTDKKKSKFPRQAGRAFEEWLDRALTKLRNRDEPTTAELESPAALLHQFSFRRLMVDEYTYINGVPLEAVLRLSAERRWIASGTPDVNSVRVVNRMAKLIGTRISNDENEGSVFETKKDLEANLKNKTAAERFLFHTFQGRRSPDWYHARYRRCEQFVEKFVRQNHVDLSDIQTETHYNVVTMPAGEWMTYLEVLQLILNSCLNFNRAKPQLGRLVTRAQRLDAFARMSGSPEEALIVSSSTSSPMISSEDPSTRFSTADIRDAFNDKCRQLSSDVMALKDERAKARFYMRRFEEDDVKVNPHLPGFDRNLREGRFGDKTAQRLIDLAIGIGEEEGAQDEIQTDSNDKGSNLKERKNHMLGVAANLTNKSLELVESVRGFRLYKQIRDLLMKRDVPKCLSCNQPNQPNPDPAKMMILTLCGHVLCRTCSSGIKDGQCPTPDCGAAVADHSAVRLDGFQQFPTQGEQFGTKINAVVQLLLDGHRIKARERVIIFVQFARIQEALQNALKRRDIDFCTISGRGNPVQSFAKGEGPRFLVLNIESTDAAGWNLQRANHVVFLHSMVASTKHHWQSSYEQAIGRVCRRGQDQEVHIWHFVTANTVDVNIMEDRTGRRLGWDGGKYSLMTVQEIAEKGLREADCALRGVDFVGKAVGAGLRQVE